MCPSPLRLYTLTVISIVTIAGSPSWVLHTGDDWAVVSAKSLSRRRRYWPQGRQIAVAVALDIALFLVVVVGALVDQLVVVLVVLAAAAAPLAWYAVASGREAFACPRLGEAERVAIRTAPGPVYYVAGLAGGGRFAGRQLVGALLRRADAGAVTLIARTEDGVLARYFRLAGFETIMTAAAAWGTVALLVRHPSLCWPARSGSMIQPTVGERGPSESQTSGPRSPRQGPAQVSEAQIGAGFRWTHLRRRGLKSWRAAP